MILSNFGWKIYRGVLWSNLRGIGNSPVARATIIMPILGYLILLNETVLHYADIAGPFRLWGGDAPWRLIAVYFGTVFLGIASAVYTFFCPIEIRKYDTAQDYIKAEGDHFSYKKFKDALEETVRDGAYSLINDINDTDKIRSLYREIPVLEGIFQDTGITMGSGVIQQSATNVLMHYQWHLRNLSYPILRSWCYIAYAIGFFALLIPSIATFYSVLKFTVSLMFR